MGENKFYLQCRQCSTIVASFSEWFKSGQTCPECSGKQVYVEYNAGYDSLKRIIEQDKKPSSLWHYHDYLPLDYRENIISFDEGIVPIDRWRFIEDFAKNNFGINSKIYVQRYDLNQATGTFKDMAGTVVASVMNENKKTSYVVASTGNIANAYAKYLAAAGITVYAFIPKISSLFMEAGIAAYGQKVCRVDGDYDAAKKMAAAFAEKHGFLLAAGNFDPMRVEAKKTMVYEWVRLMDDFPTVYIQALSGGTGPLGIQKAFSELEPLNMINTMPRQILVQSEKCAPMAFAWKKAKENNFPPNWENDYPVIENPETEIPTLSTGNPKTYPVLGKFVKETNGEIIACDETKAVDAARLVALEASVLSGPAAALPVAGLLESIKSGLIKDGDVVLLNLGEGIGRSPDFLQRLTAPVKPEKDLDKFSLYDRDKRLEQVRNAIYQTFA